MHLLAQTYTTTNGSSAGIFALYYLIIYAFFIAVFWRIFTKAGEPGWAAIIPIYNLIVFLKISGRPWWWVILFLIPLVNIVIWLVVLNDFSKSFGKSAVWILGFFFLPYIFFPIISWGSAAYIGPMGVPSAVGSGGYGGQSAPPPPPPPAPTM